MMVTICPDILRVNQKVYKEIEEEVTFPYDSVLFNVV